MDAKLIVTKRDLKGSPNARRMRRAGMIPGVIYNDGGKACEVSLPKHEFEQLLHHHTGEQMMISIDLDGKILSVLLKEVQHDVMTGGAMHVDLQEVSMNKRLRVHTAIELVGDAEGVAVEGGVLDHLLHQVEIECLPADILERIELDVSALKMGEMLTISDLPLDTSKYEILMDGDVGVATVSAPRVVEEESADEDEAAEPELLAAEKPAE